MNIEEFGFRIMNIRTKLGMSRTRAAMEAIVNNTQLKKIEDGKTDARFSTIVKISEKWGVPLIDFFQPLSLEEKRKYLAAKEQKSKTLATKRKKGGSGY